MRAVVQKVSEGGVYIASLNIQEEIKKGIVILLGIKDSDSLADVKFVADKCCNLRIFSKKDQHHSLKDYPEDEDDKMNLSLKDINGEALIISQFTVYGDTSRGNRPSFTLAAKPEAANELYERFILRVKENIGEHKVKNGVFKTMMSVKIINDGPVTLIVDSK
ncbi:MAG: D-aminoacyl-tRNA deacylase [Ignavibacteriaceae bacterium]